MFEARRARVQGQAQGPIRIKEEERRGGVCRCLCAPLCTTRSTTVARQTGRCEMGGMSRVEWRVEPCPVSTVSCERAMLFSCSHSLTHNTRTIARTHRRYTIRALCYVGRHTARVIRRRGTEHRRRLPLVGVGFILEDLVLVPVLLGRVDRVTVLEAADRRRPTLCACRRQLPSSRPLFLRDAVSADEVRRDVDVVVDVVERLEVGEEVVVVALAVAHAERWLQDAVPNRFRATSCQTSSGAVGTCNTRLDAHIFIEGLAIGLSRQISTLIATNAADQSADTSTECANALAAPHLSCKTARRRRATIPPRWEGLAGPTSTRPSHSRHFDQGRGTGACSRGRRPTTSPHSAEG